MKSEIPSDSPSQEAGDCLKLKQNQRGPLVLLTTFAALYAGCMEKPPAPAPVSPAHSLETSNTIAPSLSVFIAQYARRGPDQYQEVTSVTGSLELGGADVPTIFKRTIRINTQGERMEIDGIPTEIFDETDYENFPEVNVYFGQFIELSPFLKECTEWMLQHGNADEKEIAEQIIYRKVNGRTIGKRQDAATNSL